jgi:hypothetical protein
MKKAKPPKIRKVWVIKPTTRVKKSRKRDLVDRQKTKEARDYLP